MNMKPIPGYEEYMITPDGLVTKNGKPLKITITMQGTPMIRLRKDGLVTSYLVAKLVALTYLEDTRTSVSDVVAYKDGNNHNYHKDNLYWATRSDAYTTLYSKNNRYSELRLERLKNKICKPVMAMKKENDKLCLYKTFRSIKEGADFANVSSASVLRCLKNQNHMCAGYYWKYIDKEV